MIDENIADLAEYDNNVSVRALPPTAPSLLSPKALTLKTQSLLLNASGLAEKVGVQGVKPQQERVMMTKYSATATRIRHQSLLK